MSAAAGELDALGRALDHHPQIRLAILFGSLAKGRGEAESDLDIAVAADRGLDLAARLALSGELAETLGRPVDLVDLHEAGPVLCGEIFREGRRVRGSEADEAQWLGRSVIDREDFLPALRGLLADRRRAWIG
jgi:uncharacterized protein